MHALARFTLVACIGACNLLAQHASKPAKRPFTIDDIYRAEVITATPSPDGKLVAFTKTISPEEEARRFPDSRALRRNDLSIFNVATGTTTKIFEAGKDGMDRAECYWSPDGRFLALMVGSGDRYRIDIWTRATGKIYAATPFYAFRLVDTLVRPRQWISNTEFALWVPPQPAGYDPRVGFDEQAAVQAWMKHKSGLEPTASVLDTASSYEPTRNTGTVFSLDVGRHTSEALLQHDVSVIATAPNEERAAIVSVDPPARPDPAKRFPSLNQSLNGLIAGAVTHIWIAEGGRTKELQIPGSDRVVRANLTWSPDGTRLAYLSASSFGATPPELYVYSFPAQKTVRVQLADGTHLQSLAGGFKWIGGHQPLYFGAPPKQARQWYSIAEDGSLHALSPNNPIPSQIFPDSNSENSFLFAGEGRLWRYDLAKAQAECLTCNSSLKVSGILWTSGELAIPSVQEGESTNYYLYRSKLEELRRLKLPEGQPSSFLQYASTTNTAIFFARSGSITSLWSANVIDGSAKLIVQADNSYQDEIDRGDPRMIDYRSTDGQPLKAWLLLPYNYQPGKKYPMVVCVYPGDIWSGRDPSLNGLYAFPGSKLWFSAHGYAVLEPSMPAAVGKGDNFLDLTKGVLPAIDKVVEMGIADPDRLAVAGHSYGGYAVYGLIEQTTRFKAAIAYAAPADLFAEYGQLYAAQRYSNRQDGRDTEFSWAENGQSALGATPWDDPQRYLRNSPLFYAPRVQTPVLILHGDMDFVPMEQAEEFYSAMLRLNKPARFVRYWGEEHAVSAPANVRHLHQQMLEWLDKYLAPVSK